METPKTQSRRELVSKVFDLMGDNFTSGEFLREMIAAGADANRMYLYNYLDFLKKNCERESKKTWTKKKSETYSVTNVPIGDQAHITFEHEPEPKSKESRLEDHINFAIRLLKENGYKIYKNVAVEV